MPSGSEVASISTAYDPGVCSGMRNEPSAPEVPRPISSATLTTVLPSEDNSAAYTMTTAPGTGTLAPPAAGVY